MIQNLTPVACYFLGIAIGMGCGLFIGLRVQGRNLKAEYQRGYVDGMDDLTKRVVASIPGVIQEALHR